MPQADGLFPSTSTVVVIRTDELKEVSAHCLRARASKLTYITPSGWKKNKLPVGAQVLRDLVFCVGDNTVSSGKKIFY